jgi:DNA-binding NarL/FixJ family response regulator
MQEKGEVSAANIFHDERMRILIADEHEIVREGLRVMVERERGWEVCGVAGSGTEAIDLAQKLKPDTIILDSKIPKAGGLEVLKQIRRVVPETEILVLSASASDDLIEQVLEAGVKGYVRKADAGRLLVPALKSLQNHKTFLTEETSAPLFSRLLTSGGGERKDSSTNETLTAREKEIVRLLAEGKSNKEIASALGISIRTGETHRAALMRKLRLNSLAAVVRYAIRTGMIEA